MRKVTAEVSNITLLAGAARALLDRDEGMPGLGLIFGGSGYGKTYAIAWALKYFNGVYVRAWPHWKVGSMLRAIASVLNIDLDNRKNTRLDAMGSLIVRELSQNRVLFVDDADPVVSDSPYSVLVETLRTIHDLSGAPIVLVGTERLQRGVMENEQVAGRIARWIEFRGAALTDARLLAEKLCEVEIADDLLEDLHKRARGGSIRRICMALGAVETFARKHKLKRVTAADWGDRVFTFGEPPPLRKLATLRSDAA